jgi:hypothetical protein
MKKTPLACSDLSTKIFVTNSSTSLQHSQHKPDMDANQILSQLVSITGTSQNPPQQTQQPNPNQQLKEQQKQMMQRHLATTLTQQEKEKLKLLAQQSTDSDSRAKYNKYLQELLMRYPMVFYKIKSLFTLF